MSVPAAEAAPTPWKAPGSAAAREAGCTCPVMDNEHGLGAYADGRAYFINVQCPIHGNNVWCSQHDPASSKG